MSAVARKLGVAAWWSGRSARERLLLLGLAAVGAVYLLGVFAVGPLLAARSAALATIGGHEAALSRLAALPSEPAPQVATTAGRPVSAVVTETAPAFELAIRRIESESGGVRLTLEDADFASVILWIEALEREHGLRLVAAEMDRRTEPGMVGASLTLER